MGIFKKKCKSNDIAAAQAEPLYNTNSAADEEDDFSPIIKKQPPTRGEFQQTAMKNIASAAQSNQNADDLSESKKSSNTEDDSAVPVTDILNDDEDDFAALPSNLLSESSVVLSDTENSGITPSVQAVSDSEQIKKIKKKRQKFSFKAFRRKHIRFFKRLKISAVILVLICVGIYSYGCVTVPTDRIGRNIYIENINVSNMTFDEAANALRNGTLLETQIISLSCSGHTFEINGADVGLTARIEDTVSKAMRYGKTKNIFIDGFANALQLFAKHTVIPTANVNEDVLRAKLTEFGNQIYGELIEHKLEIGDGVVICTPGHTGFCNDTDTAYNEVIAAIENECFSNIEVTLASAAPHQYSAEEVGYFTYCDPTDAYYSYDGGTVTVVNEVNGRYINLDETAQLISQLYEGGDIIYIPYYVSYAEITAEELQSKLFNATIASYSTSYGSSSANRCANIANAAGKINGKVLAPGEVFSFNDTVGRRSAANGFYTAKEYLNGQTVDGIGGGTCQVSSTLYNAVLYADLSIVSRLNHMFPVGYCPIGQDATVSDSGVDFKFVNSMDYPIKISASTSGYTITVSIIGTQRDDPRTVKIQSTSKAVGEDTSVHTVRYVYNSSGELISTDDLGNSYYMSHKSED